MALKINDPMGLTKNKRGSNQHVTKRKSKGIRWGRVLILLIVIGAGYLYYKADFHSVEPYQLDTPVQQDDGLTPEQRANLAKQADLAKQTAILDNKKEALDAKYKADSENLDTKYKQDSAAIETQLEQVRSQEMVFTQVSKPSK